MAKVVPVPDLKRFGTLTIPADAIGLHSVLSSKAQTKTALFLFKHFIVSILCQRSWSAAALPTLVCVLLSRR